MIKFSLIPKGVTTIVEAQLKLFYLMLGANVFKGLIYLYDAQDRYNGDGSGRAIRLILTSIVLMAALRFFPKYIRIGIHWAVISSVLHLYYRVFNQDVGADIVTLQVIVMILISSFYGLNSRWGLIYGTIACAAPILSHYIGFRWTGLHQLPGHLNDLYIGINFIVILLSHNYFYHVLYGTIKEKDGLNKELVQNATSKSIFFSTMAHELRTPLNSVIGIASLLIQDSRNEKQKESLDMLKFSAENLLTLINDILDINKLEAGKLELEAVSFNCHTLLKSVFTSAAAQARGKSLEFNLEVEPDIKQQTYIGDATRLIQILFNLVGNAVKFTERGGITLSARKIAAEEGKDLLSFAIRDTGIGMSEGQQQHVFEPFTQAAAHTARKFGGTGLGLSIVKQLVEMFGSDIRLESEPGKGTTIQFDLWLKHAPAEKVPLAPSEQAQEHTLQSLKVLLVEDNIMNIYFMKQLFKRWDIVADIAENGQEAVELVANKDFDVVLMDMHMPVMDGMEATRQIRLLDNPQKASTHIIALTASVSDEARSRVYENGMNDYLQKPFQLEELRTRLQRLIR